MIHTHQRPPRGTHVYALCQRSQWCYQSLLMFPLIFLALLPTQSTSILVSLVDKVLGNWIHFHIWMFYFIYNAPNLKEKAAFFLRYSSFPALSLKRGLSQTTDRLISEDTCRRHWGRTQQLLLSYAAIILTCRITKTFHSLLWHSLQSFLPFLCHTSISSQGSLFV